MGTLRRGLPAGLAAVAALTLAPAVATAGSGGTTPPATTTGNGGGTAYQPGVTPVPAAPTTSGPRDQTPSRHGARPRLTSFSAPRRFFDLGSPARVRFRIDAGAATVHVRLEVRHAGRRVELIDLGERTTGSAQAYRLTGREGGALPEGALQLKLLARDASGRGLSPASRASDTGSIGFYLHRLPLAGAFTYGSAEGRFGAGRPGHIHQGQDLLAPQGTPVVAPRGGTVQRVAYQAGGAGNYVVLRGAGEDRTYVFMHLADATTRVTAGQTIATGARIGDVGQTGAASGPHLHFEEWTGAWSAGGRAFDPLPDLKRWDRWS